MMSNRIKLTGRELDVMNVLWEAERPLIAKDIVSINSALSINTVNAVIKTLLRKGYIKVAEIVYSGTVLTRSYNIVLTAEEYMVYQITKGISKHFRIEDIVVALLKQEKNKKEAIDKIELMLKKYKEKM